jgi:hypothetical protein
MTEDLKPVSRMSMDEILAEVDAIAKDPGDRDRFKALKMLASAQSSSIVLPEPSTPEERIQRLARIMKPAGLGEVHSAYTVAFPGKRGIIEDALRPDEVELPAELHERAQRCTSLGLLYREFPELKRPGIPRGFPRGRGSLIQRQWCQTQAAMYLLELEKKKAISIVKVDEVIRATEPPPGPEEEPPMGPDQAA